MSILEFPSKKKEIKTIILHIVKPEVDIKVALNKEEVKNLLENLSGIYEVMS